MKIRREFISSAPPDEAEERADRILRLMKFRKIGQSTHAIYERGKVKGNWYAVRPRSWHTILHLWIQPDGEGSKTAVNLLVETLSGKIPSIGELVIEGELDDLEKGVCENRLPEVNRMRQNRLAGTAHLAYLFAISGIGFGLARAFGPWTSVLPYVALVIALVAGLRLAPLMPAQMINFPLRVPKGAKLVASRDERDIPTAPTAKPRR